MGLTTDFIASADLGGAAKIGWVSAEFLGLVGLTSSSDVAASLVATVSRATRFDAAVTDAWDTLLGILEPSIARGSEVSEVVNALSATVLVWYALLNFATTGAIGTSVDQLSGVASWAGHVGVSWTIAGTGTVFDLFEAFVVFTSLWTGPDVGFHSGHNTSVLTATNWIIDSDNWTNFMGFTVTFTIATALVAFTVGWRENREVWLRSRASNWSWKYKSDLG